jgi:imidazolonepropionase-like amidohydrolase
VIQQLAWSEEAEARMRHPAAGKCIEFLRREVEQGIAKLWRFWDVRDEAYCITRLDSNPDELVVCYFEGSGMLKFGREILAASHSQGIPVRAHTTQPAVARLMRRAGLAHSEFVLRSTP